MPGTPLHHHIHRGVRIPRAFLLEVLPDIIAAEEMHVCLAFFRLLDDRGGDEAPVAERDVMDDAVLRRALHRSGSPTSADERIGRGLELALGRGTLVRFAVRQDRGERYWYYLNTPVNRHTIEAMERGAVPPPRVVWDGPGSATVVADPAVIYRLYEQNIGTLTPLIADQLTRAAADYPTDWIADAIEEAVTYNRRNWRYISRILENWQAQGRPDVH